jgi:hypothetical protein
VQYQLLGIGSGFFAHILATLLACWRRMLRTGAAAGVICAVAIEIIGFALTHQLPPSVATNALAVTLGLGLAYSVGATVFAGGLLRGALRALALLQGEAGARAEAARLTAQAQPPGAYSRLATPLPLIPTVAPRTSPQGKRPAMAPAQAPRWAPSGPGVQTSLPLSEAHLPAAAMANPMTHAVGAPAAYGQSYGQSYGRGTGAGSGPHAPPFRSIENDPTQPVTICEEDSAMVMLLPENSLYVPKFVPRWPIAPRPAASVSSQPTQGSRMGALPSPDFYAPWTAVPPLERIEPALAPSEDDSPLAWLARERR